MNPNLGGQPGDIEHPRRCIAPCRQRLGERCRKWALKDNVYCKTHKGRGRNTYADGGKMGTIFRRYMSQTLQEKLEAFLNEPHEDQISLYEELAMMRMVCIDNVKMYDAAQSTGKAEVIAMAADTLREALNSIATMVKHCADLDSKDKDKVSLRQLSLFVLQICRAVKRVIGDDNITLAEKIIAEIKANVKFPTDGVGTTSTPDEQVSNMDDTVPLC